MGFDPKRMLKIMRQYSHVARAIDPTYPTNVAISAISPVAGLIAGGITLYNGAGFGDAILASFLMSIAVLMTWVIGREIDPDNDYSAFVGVVITFLAMLWLSNPMIAIMSIAMLTVAPRFVNRIVGPPPLLTDSIMLLVLAAIIAYGTNWVLVLVVTLVFFLNATMINPVRRDYIFAGLTLVILVGRILIWGMETAGDVFSLPYIAIMVGIGIFYLLTVLANRHIDSVTDEFGYEVYQERVRAGMIVILAAGLIGALWNGDTGIVWLLPAWSAMLGVSIFRLPVTVRELLQFQQRRTQ